MFKIFSPDVLKISFFALLGAGATALFCTWAYYVYHLIILTGILA